MSLPVNPNRLSQSQCRLVVVQDQLQPCPYIDGVTARMPLRLPVGPVTGQVTDRLLDMGFRRSGDFVYQTQCPTCNQCRPTRVEVARLRITKSMRRVLSRGNRQLRCQWQTPEVDHRRLQLFNEHRSQRGLSNDGNEIDLDSYRSFLVDTCCATRELAIYLDGELVGVSIVDLGDESLSAVYTHFSQDVSRLCPGTFAILKQFEFARQTQRRYVYLGMYVAENKHLNYKARFMPQQRLIDGEWVDFDEQSKVQQL